MTLEQEGFGMSPCLLCWVGRQTLLNCTGGAVKEEAWPGAGEVAALAEGA